MPRPSPSYGTQGTGTDVPGLAGILRRPDGSVNDDYIMMRLQAGTGGRPSHAY